MQNLTRRTALAAVPALVATPVLAASVPSFDNPLALSPRFVELFAQWRDCTETADNAHAQANRLEEAAKARAGIVEPALRSKEDLPAWNAYFEKMHALPEYGEIDRLNGVASEHWSREWVYVDEMLALEPETLGDLVAQIESFIGAATPEDIDDKILLDIPNHIRRLAGAA